MRARVLRPPGIINDFAGVAGEISDGRVDLGQRDLHLFSVKEKGRMVEGGHFLL
jgi:hypothetical protein